MEASGWESILVSDIITIVGQTYYHIVQLYYVYIWYEWGNIMCRIRIFPSDDNPLGVPPK